MATRRNHGKFPLHRHKTGQWAKKIRGKRHYFGTDREVALAEYVRVRADLEGGRLPRPKQDGLSTISMVCNSFLTTKRRAVEAGELSERQWSEYHSTCGRICSQFGIERSAADIRPDDFGALKAEAASRLGVFALSKFIQMTRTVFKHAYESGLIDVPMRYGDAFEKPPRRSARLARAAAGSKMIEAESIRKMLQRADPVMRAMVLLGLNCGYGNGDVSALNRSMLTERPGWINFPRPKTGIARRCPLWLETIAALEAVHKVRPVAGDEKDQDAVFLTGRQHGMRYVRFEVNAKGTGVRRDSIKKPFSQLTDRAGVKVNGGFYTLRHVHRTVADGVKDRTACDLIMGHNDPSQAATYLESVDDSRLEAVVQHIHRWLFGQ